MTFALGPHYGPDLIVSDFRHKNGNPCLAALNNSRTDTFCQADDHGLARAAGNDILGEWQRIFSISAIRR